MSHPTTPSTNYLDPYSALAEVYQAAGFANYSRTLGPQLLELVFDVDWAGRSILEFGCGTGDLTFWLTQKSYRLVGVDSSPAMLRKAQEHAQVQGYTTHFVLGDMRTHKPEADFEMVLCMGASLNYMPTLRDLENVFKNAYQALEPGKLLVFDLQTIQGLAHVGTGDRVVSDKHGDHFILTRNHFNYETLALTTVYSIFRFVSSRGAWLRAEETHTLRGYPLQGIVRTLSGLQFKVLRTVVLLPNGKFEPFENHPEADRVIVVARKE